MPRETSVQSGSESERVPSKKPKKGEEDPVDDPMDEDGGDKEEEEGDVEEEYEIEGILDSSKDIFKDEIGYFVKWKGYPNSENSWVRESDAPNADELISQFLDKRAKEKVAERKKALQKPRKSLERSHEQKKRGRVSTKSKVDSSEEEPEQSPVQPTAKKQRKVPTSVKNKGDHEKEESDMGQFAPMDKYMHLNSWDDLVAKVETIEKDNEGILYLYGILTTGDTFRLPSTIANKKFPQKVIHFYENNLRWKPIDETS